MENILYNFIYFIGGTVKLHIIDDIVNKSMVFRVTETSCDIIHAQKKLKERFLIEKKSQRSCWVKKGKTET